jgi:outer membrane autotransporter protein
VNLNNFGVIDGGITFGGGDDRLENRAGAVLILSGQLDFGPGDDRMINAGTLALQEAGGPTTAVLDNLELFENSGVIDLRGRGAGDRLIVPGAFAASGSSQVALDVDLDGRGSPADVLQINGAVTGTTRLLVNDLDPKGPGGLAPDGIVLVDAAAGSIAAGAFALANGPIDKGAFVYDLYLRHDRRYVLASRLAPRALQTPFLTTAVQTLWHQSLGDVSDEMSEDLSPTGGFGDQGVWARLTAGRNEFKASRAQTVLGLTTTDDLGHDQSNFAVQGGLEHRFGGEAASWILGFGLGYLESNGAFADGSSFGFSGPTASLYAGVRTGGLFASMVAKADWSSLTYRTITGEARSSAHVYGLSASASYRVQARAWFVEPEASLAYASGRIDDFDMAKTPFEFTDGDSLRGRAGVRIGRVFPVGRGRAVLEPALTLAASKEFLGNNDVSIGEPVIARVRDGSRWGWGEIGGDVKLTEPGSRLSAFVQAKYEGFSDVTSGFKFGAGVRLAF